jgi:hypothetical protein
LAARARSAIAITCNGSDERQRAMYYGMISSTALPAGSIRHVDSIRLLIHIDRMTADKSTLMEIRLGAVAFQSFGVASARNTGLDSLHLRHFICLSSG